MATGDWNQEPEDNVLAKGGWLIGTAHRWTSSKPIDWALSTVPVERLSFQGPENQRAISDHQGFWLRLQDKVQACSCGRLEPSPTWHQPSFLSGQQWTQALSEAWDTAVEDAQDYGAPGPAHRSKAIFSSGELFHVLHESLLSPGPSCV